MESREIFGEFGGKGSGGTDSSGRFGEVYGNGSARPEDGGIGSDGMLKGKSGTENGWSASGGMQNGSGGIDSVGTGNSVIHGESGSALGTGSGRRWRGDSNRALVLKTRRSLSVGGSSKSGSESRAVLDFKAAREGIMTDGEEASELSPVGCEVRAFDFYFFFRIVGTKKRI